MLKETHRQAGKNMQEVEVSILPRQARYIEEVGDRSMVQEDA